MPHVNKNQLLTLLIFAMVSFVSSACISALIYKISFLLLTLGFLISSFSKVALGISPVQSLSHVRLFATP